MPYLSILLMMVCAIFFHRAAEFENKSSLMWTGLSVIISGMILSAFRWGWMECLLGQPDFCVGSRYSGYAAKRNPVKRFTSNIVQNRCCKGCKWPANNFTWIQNADLALWFASRRCKRLNTEGIVNF
ncbi:MAG: hypothetical protein WBN75_10935 [Verrucomicrobiia bacterium]|jgi:hypothetical protein